MKKIPVLILSAALLSLAACTDEKNPNDNVTIDEFGNTLVSTDCVTPITYAEEYFYGGSTGVSIKVTEATTNNIKFTCTPGSDVKGYLIQVYPVAALYSTLQNQMNELGQSSLSKEEVKQYITTAVRLTDNDTSGGHLMNEDTLGEEDFLEYEFDYINNSNIRNFTIYPDVDYVIVTQACFDKECTDWGDVSICHVKTPAATITGNPVVAVSVTPGYTSYRVKFEPNEDCSAFSYFCAPAVEIDEYVELYGEKMYHDFILTYTAEPIGKEETEYHTADYKDLNPAFEHRVSIIAFDVNGNPVPTMTEQQIQFVTVPEATVAADAKILSFDKVTSFAARFTIEMDKYCQWIFYREYPLAEAQQIMNSDEATKKAEAESLEYGGWAVENINFKFDVATNTASGSSYTYDRGYVSNVGNDDGSNNIDPDTEYAIIYVCRNGYRQLSELKMSKSFKTKALVRDNPDASEADGKLEIISSDRTSFTLRYTYNPEKTSVIYYQYYYPYGEEIGLPTEVTNENRENWIYYFIDYHNPDAYRSRWCNQLDCIMWPTFEDVKWPGFEAGTEYRFAYVAEDYNGVLGHVGSVTASTQAITGGNDPTVEISYNKNSDGTYDFTLTGNEDVRQLRYVIASESVGGVYNTFEVDEVLKKTVSYNEAKSFWEEGVIGEQALTSTNTTAHTSEYSSSSYPIVVIAMAIGGETEGTPVYGDLETLFIYEDGTTATLESHYGMTTATLKVSRTGRYAPQIISTTCMKRLSAKDIN